MLGFVDTNQSIDWMRSAGANVVNLLTKGSLRHCREQLRRTPEQHLDDIRRTVEYGAKRGMKFNVYLEDWSGGMIGSPGLRHGASRRARRAAGGPHHGLRHAGNPQSRRRCASSSPELSSAFPRQHFDYHGHNDYGLGTANTLEAAIAGARGVHCTVNGMGERAGNASLDEVVVALRDHAGLQHARQRARAGRHQQSGRSLLGPPDRREQADRRRERLHPGGRHPCRRRHEGPAVRKPSRTVTIRAPSHLCDGQADGQGQPGVQSRAAEHHADAPSRSSSCFSGSSSWAIRRSTSLPPTCRF